MLDRSHCSVVLILISLAQPSWRFGHVRSLCRSARSVKETTPSAAVRAATLAHPQRLLLPTHFQPPPCTHAVRSPYAQPSSLVPSGFLDPTHFQPLPCNHAVRSPSAQPSSLVPSGFLDPTHFQPLPCNHAVRSRPHSQARWMSSIYSWWLQYGLAAFLSQSVSVASLSIRLSDQLPASGGSSTAWPRKNGAAYGRRKRVWILSKHESPVQASTRSTKCKASSATAARFGKTSAAPSTEVGLSEKMYLTVSRAAGLSAMAARN